MKSIYTSLEGFEKDFFPVMYQERLIKEKRFEELARYLTERKIELNCELTMNFAGGEFGKLLALISLEELRRGLAA